MDDENVDDTEEHAGVMLSAGAFRHTGQVPLILSHSSMQST